MWFQEFDGEVPVTGDVVALRSVSTCVRVKEGDYKLLESMIWRSRDRLKGAMTYASYSPGACASSVHRLRRRGATA